MMKRYLYVETDPAGTSCNLRYPPEIQHKFKSREVSFAHNLLLNYPIVLKFCAEHDSLTVVRCAKYQNDWPNETNVMDEPVGTNEISRDLSLRWISDGYPIFANVDYFELKWNKWKHPIKYLHIIYSVQSEYSKPTKVHIVVLLMIEYKRLNEAESLGLDELYLILLHNAGIAWLCALGHIKLQQYVEKGT